MKLFNHIFQTMKLVSSLLSWLLCVDITDSVLELGAFFLWSNDLDDSVQWRDKQNEK